MRFPTITAKELIKIIKDRFVEHEVRASSNKKAFTFQVIQESENYMLDLEQTRELARELGIPYADPPEGYQDWIPGFSNHLTCVQYVNPKDPKDYILLVQSGKKGKLGEMIALHYRAGKFVECQYFHELFPVAVDLNTLKTNFFNDVKQQADLRQKTAKDQGNYVRGSFTKHVLNPIRTEAKKTGATLDPFSVRLLYTFFDICVPEVDGICPNCFQVSFPDSGFGISYEKRVAQDRFHEIRISLDKMGGHPQQQAIYITNTLNVTGTVAYVKWDKSQKPRFTFTRDVKEEITHLPYKVTDTQKLRDYLASDGARTEFKQLSNNKSPNLVLPICQCNPTI